MQQTATQRQQAALDRATTSNAMTNYPAIFQGFMEKGISEEDIRPRENIFTYAAWRAKGRQVRKGERGVKIVTWIECSKEDKKTGETDHFRRPKSTTVFHIDQTKSTEF